MKKNLKIITKDKLLFLSYMLLVIVFLALNIFSLSDEFLTYPLTSFSSFFLFSFLSFIFFSIWSFESFYQIKNDKVLETMQTTTKGTGFFYKNTLILNFLLVFLLSFIALIFHTILYFVFNINNIEILLYIYKVIFIHLFLVSIIGVLFGLLLGSVLDRVPAYSVLIIFLFLASPLFEKLSEIFYEMSVVNLFPLSDLFSMCMTGTGWYPNAQILYPTASFTIYKNLFWITLLCASLILFYIKKTKTKKYLVVFTILPIIFLSLYFVPTSRGLMGTGYQRHTDNMIYDNEFVNSYKDKAVPEAGFNITKYDMDLSVKRQLSANVKIYVDQNNLDEYFFTLFKTYNISSITDQNGTKLLFSHEYDWLTIDTKNINNIEYFNINYSGFSPLFVSNSDSIMLPAGFTYYPVSGHQHLYDAMYLQYLDYLPSNKIEFNLKINSKNIYTNLEKIDNGIYKGVTNGMTIMKGFLESTTKDGITFVAPSSRLGGDRFNKDFEEIKEDINKLSQEMTKINPEYKAVNTVYLFPVGSNIFFFDSYTYEGSIVTSYANNINVIPFVIDVDKQPLYNNISAIIVSNGDTIKDNASFMGPYDENIMSPEGILTVKTADKFGDEYTRNKANEYFINRDIKIDYISYLESLDGK